MCSTQRVLLGYPFSVQQWYTSIPNSLTLPSPHSSPGNRKLQSVILSEVSQTEKEKYHDIPYMWTLRRNDTDELAYRADSRTWEKEVAVGAREGRAGESKVDMYTLLYLKWIPNKNLLYSTRHSAQCYVAA